MVAQYAGLVQWGTPAATLAPTRWVLYRITILTHIGEEMGWLVIDIVVVYLLKSALRVFRFFESRKWERSTALLTDWEIVDPGWGCSSVRLHYTFAAKESLAAGSDEIPFYMHWHSKTYAESLSKGLRPIIRVNPKNPHETRFFELDQKKQTSAA